MLADCHAPCIGGSALADAWKLVGGCVIDQELIKNDRMLDDRVTAQCTMAGCDQVRRLFNAAQGTLMAC